MGLSEDHRETQQSIKAARKRDLIKRPRSSSRISDWRWKRSYVLPQWIASKVIVISFLWSNYINCWSLSPSLTLINLVDEKNSPAFQLLYEHIRLWEGLDSDKVLSDTYGFVPQSVFEVETSRRTSDQSIMQSLSMMSLELIRIFECGKASLQDRNRQNRTLLQVRLNTISMPDFS